MKIAVTYEEGQVFQHFGHTEQFKVYEVQDGKVLGLDDFVKQYREADPGAFLSEEKPPKYSGSTPGVVSAATGKDKANAAIRELLSRQ